MAAPVIASNRTYSVYLYMKNGSVHSFYSQWARARIYGTDEWKQLSDIDFELQLVSCTDDTYFMQFEVIVTWIPAKEEREDPEEEWRETSDDVDEEIERMATVTIDMREVVGVRQIYWNETDSIPPFRQAEDQN